MFPDDPERALWGVTVDGAAALGWGDQAGALVPGRRADFVVVAVDATPATAYAQVLARGAGRQVLTVLGGVRVARRGSADSPWPPLDRHELRPAPGS